MLYAEAGQIGILASLPLFANFVQIFGSYIIEKTGERKSFSGKIESIDFVTTRLSSTSGVTIIPNAELVKAVVKQRKA